MRKWLPVIGVLVLLFGCGPKGASQETMDRLAESKTACESAETRAKNLEAQRIKLEEEVARKQAILEDLQKQMQELEKPTPKK
jgi:predicted nuclease with TOPRIM domain